MAADAWKRYDKFPEYLGDGTIDMDNDTFKVALFLSTSNAASLGVGTGLFADLTNEVAGVNGYTTGGVVLANVTWVEATGTLTFDCDDPSWTASGGSITYRFAVIYDDTPTSPAKPLIAMTLIDNAPADHVVADGNTHNLQINASGVLTISGGQ